LNVINVKTVIKKVLFTLLIPTIVITTYSSSKAQEYRQLTFADFKGSPSIGSTFTALITWRVNYTYKFIRPSNKLEFSVGVFFYPYESYFRIEGRSKKYLNKILNHEQMHFAIAEMMNRDVKRSFNDFKYSKNHKAEIDSIFSSKLLKYQQMNQKYDHETNHGIDDAAQKIWDIFITNSLK